MKYNRGAAGATRKKRVQKVQKVQRVQRGRYRRFAAMSFIVSVTGFCFVSPVVYDGVR